MNITEFAEQIVFGKTLAEKLAAPGRLAIDPNRKPVGEIVAPGRPYGLEMRTSGHVGLTRPRDDNLENDCLLYTSPSPRDRTRSRMPSSA